MQSPKGSATSDDGITFSGIETLDDVDRRLFALLYGRGWPGSFDPNTTRFAIPLQMISSRFNIDEEAVLDALARLSRVTIRVKKGVMAVTVPCLRFYELCEGRGHPPVLAYRVPDEVRPYLASIATQLG